MTRDSTHPMTWVPHDIKERFGALARAQGMSESALLKRLVLSRIVVRVNYDMPSRWNETMCHPESLRVRRTVQ